MSRHETTGDLMEKGNAEVERAHPDVSKPSSGNRNKWYAVGLLACGVLFAAIFTPLYLRDNDGNGDSTPVLSSSFLSIEGPFKVNLTLLNENITQGYDPEDPTLFRADVTNAARFFLNGVLKRNSGVFGYDEVGRGPSTPIFAEASPGDADTSPVGDNLNDFGTNNQEAGVEEGDVIVSDGNLGMCRDERSYLC
jgi:hypothetical protein